MWAFKRNDHGSEEVLPHWGFESLRLKNQDLSFWDKGRHKERHLWMLWAQELEERGARFLFWGVAGRGGTLSGLFVFSLLGLSFSACLSHPNLLLCCFPFFFYHLLCSELIDLSMNNHTIAAIDCGLCWDSGPNRWTCAACGTNSSSPPSRRMKRPQVMVATCAINPGIGAKKSRQLPSRQLPGNCLMPVSENQLLSTI